MAEAAFRQEGGMSAARLTAQARDECPQLGTDLAQQRMSTKPISPAMEFKQQRRRPRLRAAREL